MIQQWIDNGCDYQEGIKIYEEYNVNSVYLERFKQRENDFFRKKMKDDLIELLDKNSISQETQFDDKKIDLKTKPLEFYPVELHEVFHDRISTHLQARSLKLELNKLGFNEAEAALPIIIKIDKLFQQNEKCWSILNHYEDTSQILPYHTKNNYKELSPMARLKVLRNTESAASKLKKNILRWESELQNYDQIRRFKKEQDLQIKQHKLQSLINDIQELKDIINETE